MSFDLAIFGTLVLSPGEMSAWKRLVVDPSRYRTIARVFPRSPDLAPCTVATLLKELPAAGGYDLLSIERDEGIYRVSGQFAEKAFRKHARQLAALFMSGTEVDADGDVYFLAMGVREGYAIQLSGGQPELMTLEDEEIERRSRDPMLDAISGHFRVAMDSRPPPPPRGPLRLTARKTLLRVPRGKP
jgi:hypothetical protein